MNMYRNKTKFESLQETTTRNNKYAEIEILLYNYLSFKHIIIFKDNAMAST